MTIRALRILPPLAIARLGSSPEPLENYDVRVVEGDPLGFRKLVPAATLKVDARSGAITGNAAPRSIRFKDSGGRVKPTAPFLEVWADTGGELVPLTLDLLAAENLTVADVKWTVRAGNHKAFRRTEDENDKVTAVIDAFSDHARKPLLGTCPNFVANKTLPFGHVQFIKPTKAFPEIRLRFTPAKGLVYGSTRHARDKDYDEVLYDSARGRWSGYTDDDKEPGALTTNPAPIYASVGTSSISKGYLDDECDGIVEVQIGKLKAIARFGAGPPDYAPDSFPVRTVADELEQALLGPEVSPEEVSQEWTEEILRRAFETIRLQNTAALNGNVMSDGQVANSMALQDTNWGPDDDSDRLLETIMAPAIVDNLALRALHQSIFTALASDTAAWFGQVLRDYDKVGDLTTAGRRRMPAMMRNADGMHLALTRRQVNGVRASGNRTATADNAAAVTFTAPTDPAAAEQPRLKAKPKNQTARAGRPLAVQAMDGSFAPKSIAFDALHEQLSYRAAGNPPGTLPTTAISNCFPGLEFDFRNVWKKMFEGIELHESDNFVVRVDAGFEDLERRRLIAIHVPGKDARQEVVVRVFGPNATGPEADLGNQAMEWANVFAELIAAAGKTVVCEFTRGRADVAVSPAVATKRFKLKVRRFFAPDSAVVAEDVLEAGELTQSLCSPWQNDYRECACYYWAASRPDYVNVEASPTGTSVGENWMQKRNVLPKQYLSDHSNDDRRLFTYVDIFKRWETVLKFEIEGRDSE
jgi:hypothetical protein